MYSGGRAISVAHFKCIFSNLYLTNNSVNLYDGRAMIW